MLTLQLILETAFQEGGGSGLGSHLMAWFNIELLGGRKSIFTKEIAWNLSLKYLPFLYEAL
jgi:hypothetical protein